MPKLSDVLSSLSEVGGYVGIVANIAGVAIPLGKALVSDIQKIGQGADETYQVLVQTDTAALDSVQEIAGEDLAAINAELVRQGAPPLAVPASVPDPAPPSTSPAST